MIKCVNKYCKKDPTKSPDKVVVNEDGDLACNTRCLEEYKHQQNTFFDDDWWDIDLGPGLNY